MPAHLLSCADKKEAKKTRAAPKTILKHKPPKLTLLRNGPKGTGPEWFFQRKILDLAATIDSSV